jgi:hypothetical protein
MVFERPPANFEGFESGDFSAFGWTGDWVVTPDGRIWGNFCAKAGTITDSNSSTLQVQLNCQAGTISFWSKVSSERRFDKLTFYINGAKMSEWSGEVDWANHSYSVSAGAQTFLWTYSKDSSSAGGADTAWIDNILFPIPP